jgi:hypothetical protein
MDNTHNDISVRLDDRIRLMSAALAATGWPVQAQQRRPHGTHAHARATVRFLAGQRGHPAVQALQGLLDQGAPLEAMFTYALCLSWPGLEPPAGVEPAWVPPRWSAQLSAFHEQAGLAEWWQSEDAPWQQALTQAQRVLAQAAFKPFLLRFIDAIPESLVFIPSISYPTDQDIGVRLADQLVCIAPPRLAWGDSPPWPFDEDPTYVYRAVLGQYGRMLLLGYLRAHSDRLAAAAAVPLPVSDQFRAMYPSWEEQFVALFVAAAVAIYLEQYVSQKEADAYVLMAHKAQGMTILPGTISVLHRYLREREAGRYDTLLDFLPVFPKQLRVAKRLVSL